MSPDEVTRLLHSGLDDVAVPDQPWAAVGPRLRRRRRSHQVKAAAGLTAAMAVVAITTGLAIVLPGQGARHVVAGSPGAGVYTPTAVASRPAAPRHALRRVTAAMATRPGFLMYVAGRDLLGPNLSPTSIAGGNSGWPAARNNAVSAASPAGQAYWSPSVNAARTSVVFVKGTTDQIGRFAGEGDLVIARIDGSNAHTVTNANTDSGPVWSPDGRQVAFLRSGSIWLMAADGSHQHPLGLGDTAHTIAWSPNGKELAIGSGSSHVRIGIINIPRHSFKWFTPAGNIEQYDPSWSPDGKKLVYGQTGPNAIFIANVNGKGARQLTTCNPPLCTQDVEPVWSPDGSQIAFVRSVYGVQQIEVVAVAGGKVKPVTAGPEQHNLPSW